MGAFPTVKVWKANEVYYAGGVVAFDGGTYQATRDTGSAPSGKDWTCLAVAGRDARSPRAMGTYKEGQLYEALDVVTTDSSSFIAKQDDPGKCPGPGWQMLACAGRKGTPGEPGAQGPQGSRGPKGERGEPGHGLASFRIDRKAFRVIAQMSDGTERVLELRELFEEFQVQTK